MKTTTTTTTYWTRAAMTLLLLLTMAPGTWATEFITDVKLIGGSKSEVNTLKDTYEADGWTVINYDLNTGAGGDYIYLMYKLADNFNTGNLTFITDFYLSNKTGTVDKDITYDGRTYHLVPYDGGSHFVNIQGNLNSNAGGSDIHLYYTTAFKLDDQLSPDNMAVYDITFNADKTNAVGKNGGDTGYDLNAGCGSSTNYIYMHLSTSRANYWTIQKNTDGTRCRIRGYEGDKLSSVKAIPAIIEGAAVEDIYPNVVFTDFKALEKIYFHSSFVITTMPSVANLSKLTNVHLVDNNGHVTENELPPSITTIPDGTFKNTPLKGLKMPNVSSIGTSAFNGCTCLDSVTIGNSIASIGKDAFLNCNALESIHVESGSPAYDSRDNCNAIIETSSNTLIVGSKKTIIPSSVTSIGNSAFYGRTGLTSIAIPDNVTTIGEKAFLNCTNLDTVAINCNAVLNTSSSIKDIFGNQVKKYTIGDNVTSIGDYAFSKCSSLTSVNIPDKVTTIGNYAFNGCSSLTSITIPDNVTSLGEFAFSECSKMTSVTIGRSVTTIGDYAFNCCSSLTTVTIPDNVTSIGDYAFSSCSSLNSVTIGKSVTSIGYSAFSGCSNLRSVTIGNSVTTIGDLAFDGCSSLTSVTIPDNVTSIGGYAFNGCSSLTSVTIPDKVKSIGDYAFSECSNLKSVTIGKSVTSIGDYAFGECNALLFVTIGNSVTSIGDYAFNNCSTLISVTIGKSVTNIGDYAFSNCSTLRSVTIPNSVTSIGSFAFNCCSGLASVTIGKSVTSIGQYAFTHCKAVTDMYCYANPSVLTWPESGSDEFKENKATKCHVFNAEDWSGFVSTINVTFVGDMTIDLADKADNDSLITSWNNRKVNARLTGRTLQKDGNWHTLCLPFALTSVGGDLQSPTFSGTPLEGATVVELDVAGTYNGRQTGYDPATGTLHLYFKSASGITAGKPYLIKWANGDDIVRPIFHDLYFSTDAPATVTSSDSKVTFTGSYAPVSFTGEDKTTLFLDDGNKLHYPDAAMTINAFRARLLLPEGLVTTDLGDVNGDQAITISDVMAVVNYIMGKTSSNFIINQADVNGDNQISVADVMELVNRVVHGTNSFKVVTNLDDFPITYGGGGNGPARTIKD